VTEVTCFNMLLLRHVMLETGSFSLNASTSVFCEIFPDHKF
jgi:hypothetical protein